MSYGIKSILAFSAAILFAGPAQADMAFQKNDDNSIVLTLKSNDTAIITKAQTRNMGTFAAEFLYTNEHDLHRLPKTGYSSHTPGRSALVPVRRTLFHVGASSPSCDTL